jgi:hypothetical protein
MVVRYAMTKQHVVAHATSDLTDDLRLIHGHCRRRDHVDGSQPALLPASEPAGLA